MQLVQGWVTSAGSGGGTSDTITFPGSVTAGNLLVVIIRNGFTSTVDTTYSVSGGGNTLIEAIRTTIGTNSQWTSHIFYLENVVGGFTTLTVTGANAGFFAADGAELSGALQSNDLDTVGNHDNVFANTTPDSGSLTSSATGLVVAAVVDNQNNTPYTQTGTGWTDIVLAGGGGASSYRLGASAGTYQDTWSFAVQGSTFGVIAAFKDGAAAGGTPFVSRIGASLRPR